MNEEILQEARRQIGIYLKGIRTERKMSRNELVRKTGLTYQQIIKIEEGKGGYNIDSFLRITSALDCYFYLADREGKHLDFDHMHKQSGNPI